MSPRGGGGAVGTAGGRGSGGGGGDAHRSPTVKTAEQPLSKLPPLCRTTVWSLLVPEAMFAMPTFPFMFAPAYICASEKPSYGSGNCCGVVSVPFEGDSGSTNRTEDRRCGPPPIICAGGRSAVPTRDESEALVQAPPVPLPVREWWWRRGVAVGGRGVAPPSAAPSIRAEKPPATSAAAADSPFGSSSPLTLRRWLPPRLRCLGGCGVAAAEPFRDVGPQAPSSPTPPPTPSSAPSFAVEPFVVPSVVVSSSSTSSERRVLVVFVFGLLLPERPLADSGALSDWVL